MSVVGKDRLPCLSDQPYLPYTCAVVMETQRLATVMPFMYPHTTTDKTSFIGMLFFSSTKQSIWRAVLLALVPVFDCLQTAIIYSLLSLTSYLTI